jgi:CRISPR-associated exonuclease Cas4
VALAANQIRNMMATGQLPPPLDGEQAAKRCKACSLIDQCQPEANRNNLKAMRAALFVDDPI